MARILVIEDEPDIRQVLAYNLSLAGHEIECAARAEDGLRQARQWLPELVLLDLMLPDGSGTEICRLLKQDPATRYIAVLVLTARGDEIDRVVAFELGADDYVTKPFSMRELILRIAAVLKRTELGAQKSPTIEFGVLRIERDAHRVWVESAEVDLTALEFKLLVTLYDRKGRVQSRSALLDQVWGMDASVSMRSVDAHVKRLREKLGRARDYVETVRGVGYRFAEESA
jgi:two-component system, OmpR family, phosphate regulon response regulator PhoB